MANHLLSCGLQSHNIKQRIEAHKEKYSDSTKSPTHQRILLLIPYMTDPGLTSGSSSLSSIPMPIPQLHVSDHPLRYQPYPMEVLRYRDSPKPQADMPLSTTFSFDSLHPSKSASQVSYQGPSSWPPSWPGWRHSSIPKQCSWGANGASLVCCLHKAFRTLNSPPYSLRWVSTFLDRESRIPSDMRRIYPWFTSYLTESSNKADYSGSCDQVPWRSQVACGWKRGNDAKRWLDRDQQPPPCCLHDHDE